METLKYLLIAIVTPWTHIYFTNTLILVEEKQSKLFAPDYICTYFNGRGFVTIFLKKDYCPNVYRQH